MHVDSTPTPGGTMWVAFEFAMEPSWHIYWKDPGDSGMAPNVKWTLPEGFVASELLYPKPETLKTSAGVNYVYHGTVALLAKVSVPESYDGTPIELKAKIDYLECDADLCLPASANVSVKPSDVTEADARKFAQWKKSIEEARDYDPRN